jgi:hypothetical protein
MTAVGKQAGRQAGRQTGRKCCLTPSEQFFSYIMSIFVIYDEYIFVFLFAHLVLSSISISDIPNCLLRRLFEDTKRIISNCKTEVRQYKSEVKQYNNQQKKDKRTK